MARNLRVALFSYRHEKDERAAGFGLAIVQAERLKLGRVAAVPTLMNERPKSGSGKGGLSDRFWVLTASLQELAYLLVGIVVGAEDCGDHRGQRFLSPLSSPRIFCQ